MSSSGQVKSQDLVMEEQERKTGVWVSVLYNYMGHGSLCCVNDTWERSRCQGHVFLVWDMEVL